MKRKQLVILFSAAAFTVTVGCKPQSNPPATPDTNRPAAMLDNARQETAEAIQATKDYAYGQRTEFVDSMRAQIAELNKEIDQLSAQAQRASAESKAEADARVASLKEKVAQLNAKLDSLNGATESTWNDVKTGVKTGYEETKDAFKQARQWLSEKIAP